MYRLCAGLADAGSVAKLVLPLAFGCFTAPRRYITPLCIAHAGVPVTRLDVLADCHPLASVSGFQVSVASLGTVPGLASAPCTPARDELTCAGAAAAAVAPSTASRATAGNISRADRKSSDGRGFMLVLS